MLAFLCKDINTGHTSSHEIYHHHFFLLRSTNDTATPSERTKKKTALTGRKLLTSCILTKRATLGLNSEIRNDNKSASSNKST